MSLCRTAYRALIFIGVQPLDAFHALARRLPGERLEELAGVELMSLDRVPTNEADDVWLVRAYTNLQLPFEGREECNSARKLWGVAEFQAMHFVHRDRKLKVPENALEAYGAYLRMISHIYTPYLFVPKRKLALENLLGRGIIPV